MSSSEVDVDDQVSDPGYRSRSQSRRARRQRQKQGGPRTGAQAQSGTMSSIPENQQNAPAQSQSQSTATAEQPGQDSDKAMQPFEWIGPDSTSMDGPVTYARAQRGEIPMREGNPNQKLATAGGEKQESSMMDQDGLKLRLELNLDVEVELKAKIYGDLTLALLA